MARSKLRVLHPRHLWVALFALLFLIPFCAPHAGVADIPTRSATGTLNALNANVPVACLNGQSSADIYVSNSGSLVGTVEAQVAPTSSGPWSNPFWATVAGSTSNQITLTAFPGHIYVSLGSTPYVEVTVSAYTSGSAVATVTCSAAIALNHGGGGGGGGPSTVVTASPGVTVTQTTSSPPTYQVGVPLSTATPQCLAYEPGGLSWSPGPGCTSSASGPTPYPTPVVTPSPGGPITVANTTGGAGQAIFSVGIANGPCLGIASAQEVFTCPTAGPQSTPSPSATGCGIWTGAWPYVNDTTACAGLALPNTFTANNTFTAGIFIYASPVPPEILASPTAAPASCPNSGPAATFCIGSPTNTQAVAIGKSTGGWGGTTSSGSGQLCFYKNNGTADADSCIFLSSGGTLALNSAGGASAISTNSASITAGSGTITSGKLVQNATNDFAGTCTNSSGTTCTATLVASFTTPLCYSEDQSATNKVASACAASGTTVTVTNAGTSVAGSCAFSASTTCTATLPYGWNSYVCLAHDEAASVGVYCSVSGTTVTLTASSSTSDSFFYLVMGVPSATSHVFNYLIIPNPT